MIPCATCGAAPAGEYHDGSPRYPLSCIHPPIWPGDPVHPAYLAAIRSGAAEKLVIELDDAELAVASDCGKLRFDQSRRRKNKDKLYEPSMPANVTGAQGEVAFAKWLGVPFVCTTGAYKGAADVAGCQVKTRTKTSYELVVHEDDPNGIPVVLVVAHPPRFWIRGWMIAGEAKRPEYRSNPDGRREAWFIPNNVIRPMQEFLHHPRVRAAMNLPPEGMT